MIGGDPARRIFCAIDTDTLPSALRLAKTLGRHIGGVKVGLEFFTAVGPEGVKAIAAIAPLFLDLKFHDIPNTVAGAVRSAVALRPVFLTVHVTGGEAMLRAAKTAAVKAAVEMEVVRPLLLGVTVLTSLDQTDLDRIGLRGPTGERTFALAELAERVGLDGVVASAQEAKGIRDRFGPDFKLVVPGLRPAFTKNEDQKRAMTPAEAVAAGADFLVIGRPITQAADPLEALQRIVEEIDAGP